MERPERWPPFVKQFGGGVKVDSQYLILQPSSDYTSPSVSVVFKDRVGMFFVVAPDSRSDYLPGLNAGFEILQINAFVFQ
jgi:hypothetical protein